MDLERLAWDRWSGQRRNEAGQNMAQGCEKNPDAEDRTKSERHAGKLDKRGSAT